MTTVKQQSPSGLHLKKKTQLLIHSLTLPLTTHSKRTKGQHWSLSGLQFKIKPHAFFFAFSFTPMIHSNATAGETFQSTLQNYLQRPTSHPVPSAIHLPSCPVSIPPPLLSLQHSTKSKDNRTKGRLLQRNMSRLPLTHSPLLQRQLNYNSIQKKPPQNPSCSDFKTISDAL